MHRQPPDSKNGSCLRYLGCAAAVLAGFVMLFCSGSLALAALFARIDSELLDLDGASREDRIEALVEVIAADLGEDPRIALDQPTGALPVCRGVPRNYGHALRLAFGLMRGTDEGKRLYALLIEQDICVGVTDLSFNAAYASARHIGDDWSSSTIMVDRQYVRSLSADVLAAILVHEATHLDRAIAGTACWEHVTAAGDACTTLANGVKLEEEVAAHRAEAEWWRATYGDDGKRFAWNADHSENGLLEVYLRGPDDFLAYVRDLRSDPHEGEGI